MILFQTLLSWGSFPFWVKRCTFFFVGFGADRPHLCIQRWSVNLLPVRPMKGRTALASRCLRSPLFGELTWVNLPRKSWEGGWDFTTTEEERWEEEEDGGEEVVWPPLQSSPSQPEGEKGTNSGFVLESPHGDIIILFKGGGGFPLSILLQWIDTLHSPLYCISSITHTIINS